MTPSVSLSHLGVIRIVGHDGSLLLDYVVHAALVDGAHGGGHGADQVGVLVGLHAAWGGWVGGWV